MGWQGVVVLLGDGIHSFVIAWFVLRLFTSSENSNALPRHYRLNLALLVLVPLAALNLLASGWDWLAWVRYYITSVLVVAAVAGLLSGLGFLPFWVELRSDIKANERKLDEMVKELLKEQPK